MHVSQVSRDSGCVGIREALAIVTWKSPLEIVNQGGCSCFISVQACHCRSPSTRKAELGCSTSDGPTCKTPV